MWETGGVVCNARSASHMATIAMLCLSAADRANKHGVWFPFGVVEGVRVSIVWRWVRYGCVSVGVHTMRKITHIECSYAMSSVIV
jgi:hypothetical protein